MTWAVRLTDKAVADIAQAQDWYELQRVGLGGQFVGEVDKVLESLAENPLIYRKVMDLLARPMRAGFLIACISESKVGAQSWWRASISIGVRGSHTLGASCRDQARSNA